MNEEHPKDDLDFSEMSDDELLEIVNSRFSVYPPETVDGAKNELKRRADAPATVESSDQVIDGEAPPPPLPTTASGGGLFSAGQVALATALGAPIAGCVLLAKNYRALGKKVSAWRPLAGGMAVTMLLIVIGFLLPEGTRTTGVTIGIAIGMYYFAKHWQGGVIESHLKAGGKKGSWATTIGVGVGSMALLLVIIFAIVMTFDVGPPLDEQNRPVAMIKVSRAGQIDLNGSKVTPAQLRNALADYGIDGGVVWYYREGWRERPSEEALRVFEIIMDARLPLRMSSKPDFSDYIDENGTPVPLR